MANPPGRPQTTGGKGPVDPLAELTGLWGGGAPGRPAPPTATPTADTGPGPVRRLTFHGTGSDLFRIYIVNILLILVTLGIYYFWAKTRVRRYIASQAELDGDRFAYHGTGRELLLGALKAALVFAIPFALLNLVPLLGLPRLGQVLAGVLAYLLLALLVPVAIVGARRYRLTRMSWRGIRFSFRGPTAEFIKLFVGGSLLSALTLGLYYPFFAARRQQFLVSHAYFGNQRFGFDGQGRELFWIYVRMVLLWLPTLGFYWFWFEARRRRYIWDHTTFASARFRSTVTGDVLLGLKLVNALLLIVTLGLAAPWVVVRNARVGLQYLTLDGPVDLGQIQQDAQVASATGEGLAGFLDTGFELGW